MSASRKSVTARLAMTRLDMFWRCRCSSRATRTSPFPPTIHSGMTDRASRPHCGDGRGGGGAEVETSTLQFKFRLQNRDVVTAVAFMIK